MMAVVSINYPATVAMVRLPEEIKLLMVPTIQTMSYLRILGVLHLEFSNTMRLLFVLLSGGELIQCSVSKRDLKHTESVIVEKRLASGEAVFASVAPDQQILAVGTQKGAVELYDLPDSASLIRSVSLQDWDTGPVNCIAWTPDNSAFAVGWKLRGLTIWSVSGCRLMSTICQIGLRPGSSPVVKPNQDFKYEPMMG